MRRYKAYFIVILLQIWGLSVVAQDSTTQLLLLPKGGEVATIYFDPLECQTAGGLFYYKDDGKPPDMIYAIFNLGFQKPMLRWEKTNNKSWNLGIEVASYTQFEFVDVEGSFKRYMLNSDFKFGIPLVYHHNKWSFRIEPIIYPLIWAMIIYSDIIFLLINPNLSLTNNWMLRPITILEFLHGIYLPEQ